MLFIDKLVPSAMSASKVAWTLRKRLSSLLM